MYTTLGWIGSDPNAERSEGDLGLFLKKLLGGWNSPYEFETGLVSDIGRC